METKVEFRLTFLGASKTVTGSSYLLEIYDGSIKIISIMVDHGMFQGPNVEDQNYDKYTFDPKGIDLLLLTHGHIDHCGMIPRLVKEGFSGEVVCSPVTEEILEYILPDSVKIQAIQARLANKDMYYQTEDVSKTLDMITNVEKGEVYEIEVAFKDNYSNTREEIVEITPSNAGHILGALSYTIRYKNKSITFSGDIGRRTQDILYPFKPVVNNSDYIVMESLYGGKFHQPKSTLIDKFSTKISKVIARDGNVILPTFSIQRSQEVLVLLNKLIQTKRLPIDVQIYFDSPLAQKVTKVYTNNPIEINKSTLTPFSNIRESLFTKNVEQIFHSGHSKRVMKETGVIIVTGGGMCNGGKVLAYFKKMLKSNDNLVGLVGFQAEETLGRELVEGADKVTIDNKQYKVNAEIEMFNGFSAHGDQNDLLDWLSYFNKDYVKKVFLVHAEIPQAQHFQNILTEKEYEVEIPGRYQQYNL